MLNVGCSDFAMVSVLVPHQYIGLDCSQEVSFNEKKRRNRQFVAGNLPEVEVNLADRMVCWDVPIDLPCWKSI